MFKYYTETLSENFRELEGTLKKVIFLAYKKEDKYFPLLELRIRMDKTVYFNDKNLTSSEMIYYLEEEGMPLKPTMIPENMIRKSNFLEKRLLKKEFEKRIEKLILSFFN